MSLYGFYLTIVYCDALYLLIQYIKGKPINKIISPITWLIADNKLMKILLQHDDESVFSTRDSLLATIVMVFWIFLLIPIEFVNFIGICAIIFIYIIALIILICMSITTIRNINIKKRNKKEEDVWLNKIFLIAFGVSLSCALFGMIMAAAFIAAIFLTSVTYCILKIKEMIFNREK